MLSEFLILLMVPYFVAALDCFSDPKAIVLQDYCALYFDKKVSMTTAVDECQAHSMVVWPSHLAGDDLQTLYDQNTESLRRVWTSRTVNSKCEIHHFKAKMYRPQTCKNLRSFYCFKENPEVTPKTAISTISTSTPSSTTPLLSTTTTTTTTTAASPMMTAQPTVKTTGFALVTPQSPSSATSGEMTAMNTSPIIKTSPRTDSTVDDMDTSTNSGVTVTTVGKLDNGSLEAKLPSEPVNSEAVRSSNVMNSNNDNNNKNDDETMDMIIPVLAVVFGVIVIAFIISLVAYVRKRGKGNGTSINRGRADSFWIGGDSNTDSEVVYANMPKTVQAAMYTGTNSGGSSPKISPTKSFKNITFRQDSVRSSTAERLVGDDSRLVTDSEGEDIEQVPVCVTVNLQQPATARPKNKLLEKTAKDERTLSQIVEFVRLDYEKMKEIEDGLDNETCA